MKTSTMYKIFKVVIKPLRFLKNNYIFIVMALLVLIIVLLINIRKIL